jgi:hypothetical protein
LLSVILLANCNLGDDPTPPDPGLLDKMIAKLEAADSTGVFLYQTPDNKWLPSTLYTWKDMIEGVKIMASQGIGS